MALAVSGVEVGLERVARDGGEPLRGRRVGLVAHAASVTADGRHAIEVLREAGVELRRVFTPEHGLRGEAAAGEPVGDGIDAASGLPIVSLYGARQRPRPGDLADLDVLVVDLQGAGVRFYTYASTLILCLEAALGAGIDLVVLDRPNPLGGERVAGPVREPDAPRSLLTLAPGPLLHGLTPGELARLVAARRGGAERVSVVPMKGWRREMTWVDTGRPWVAPSPNLRSPEAALAYPGTALLEATNVSEGRGSDAPFLRLGAPWLNARRLTSEVSVAGFALEVEGYTPRPERAAPVPRYAGVSLPGVRVRVTDPAAADPWRLGLELLRALRREPAFAWRAPDALDRLVGGRGLREALEAGRGTEAILDAEAAGVAAFRGERKPFLLYPSEGAPP